MLSEKVEKALNEQINAEIWSAYLYLSMSMNFEAQGLTGAANWFFVQYREELDHARIFMNYVNRRDGRVRLMRIAPVDTDWDRLIDAMTSTLAHEQKVTSMINNLYALADAEHDYATRDQLNWFISEQVEEEETAKLLIDKLKLIGDNGTGLYMLDQELAQRVYATPAPLANAQ